MIEAAIRDGDLPGLHHIIEANTSSMGTRRSRSSTWCRYWTRKRAELRWREPGHREDGAGCEGRSSRVGRGDAEVQGEGGLLRPSVLGPALPQGDRRCGTRGTGRPDLAASASRAVRDLGEGGVPVELTELNRTRQSTTGWRSGSRWCWGTTRRGKRGHSTSGNNPVNVQGTGMVDAKKGDRIAITGIFRHQPPGERMIVEAVVGSWSRRNTDGHGERLHEAE